jgi:hypothetical protein
MREYSFQHTKQRDLLLLMLACTLSLFIIMLLGIFLLRQLGKQNVLPVTIFAITAPFLVFRIFKNRVVNNCIAKLNKTSVEFEFKNNATRLVSFKELISYKIYYSKKGPFLTLKMNNDIVKIFAHGWYCDEVGFTVFCEALETEIENYKIETKINIIKEISLNDYKSEY